MDPNHLYYIVGTETTASKNQALIWAGGDPHKIYFYQADHYWDQQSWTVEPAPSFRELCVLRCHQLRQKYDWLCLWLSAGYDSMTILQSFIDARIPIDEIAYVYRKDHYNDPEIPYIEATIKNYQLNHHANVTVNRVVIDFDYTLDVYKRLGEDILYHRGQNHKLTKSTATFIHHYHEKLLAHKDTTPVSRADIYGKEKPRLDIRNGWWYAVSFDAMWQEQMQSPVEYFYISDQLPELHIKQCHMVASWMDTVPGMDHVMVHRIQSNDPSLYRPWNLASGRIEITCPQSRHGLVKKDFVYSLEAPDGKKIYDHLARHDIQMLHALIDRDQQLKQFIGDDLVTIAGKSWALKPCCH